LFGAASTLFAANPTSQDDVQIDLFYDSSDSWFAVWDNDSSMLAQIERLLWSCLSRDSSPPNAVSCEDKRKRASLLNNMSVVNTHITYGNTEIGSHRRRM
jgi:hypothetical protein